MDRMDRIFQDEQDKKGSDRINMNNRIEKPSEGIL
jgi:hypothetical protein